MPAPNPPASNLPAPSLPDSPLESAVRRTAPGAASTDVFYTQVPAEPANAAGDDTGNLDIARYLDALRKRLWLVILGVVVGGAIAGGWTMRQPKLYRASVTVIIDTQTANVLGQVAEIIPMGTGGFWANESFYQKEYTVLRSRAVARRAAEKLGLLQDDVRTGLAQIEDLGEREKRRSEIDPASLTAGRYSVEPAKSGNVVEIKVVDTDPAFAAALANAAAEAYAELNLEKRVGGTHDASLWLEVQHRDLKQKLEASEDNLYKFMEENGVLNASLQSQLDEVLQRLTAFNSRLAETQAERIRQSLNAQVLKDVQENKALTDSIVEIQQAPVIASLKALLVKLRTERAELGAKYQEAHPRMLANAQQATLIRQNLEVEIDSILLSSQRKQASLEATEAGLKSAIRTERSREARLNKLWRDYERLKREIDTNARLYELVATRRKEADLSGALRLNNISILDRARAPAAPFKPNMKKNLPIGLLAGLMLAMALAILIDMLDNSLKSQEDVEATLATAFLGLMPVIEPADLGSKGAAVGELQDRDLFVLKNPKSSPAECARFIRTNLLFMSPDKPLKTLMVTSAGPQEGKTTTAVSLAVIMAQSGSKTLIVDTDMRRPRLHRTFGVPNERGLSSVIVGEATLDDAVQATDAPGLDVLVCGPIPPNPAELLHTAAFAGIVQQLSDRYDRILFDSPPVGAVTDPVILGTQMDGTVLVLKAQKTARDSARRTLRTLLDANVPVFGAVLNDVDLRSKRYGSGYYAYYRKYGYYYGEDPSKAVASENA